MNIEDINLGDPPTGAGGDTMRTAFGKTNQNFGAAKQALEDEVQTREQRLETQRDQLIALIESVNGPLPALRADFKVPSFGSKNAAGLFLPCDYSDLFTLSAPSPKWVWNAQGQLVEIPAGQPAWDHDPVTGEPLGQRIESVEDTNTAVWSQLLSNWNTGQPGYSQAEDNVIQGPDGNISLSRIELLPAADRRGYMDGNSLNSYVSGDVRYLSAFFSLEDPTVTTFAIGMRNASGRFCWGAYNVLTGDFSTTSFGSAGNIELVSEQNIWGSLFKLTVKWTCTLETVFRPCINMGVGTADEIYNGANLLQSGTIGAGFVSVQESASSYIPTSGSAVTRAADVATIENVDTAEWFSGDAKALLLEINRLTVAGAGSTRIIGPPSPSIRPIYYADGQIRCFDGSAVSASNVTIGDTFRVAVTWDGSTKKIIGTGGDVGSSVHNGNLNTALTELEFFALREGQGHISQLIAKKRLLTDAEMQTWINGGAL